MSVRYIVQRTAIFVLVIVLAVTVNFAIPRLIPGDPVEQQLAQLSATSSGSMSIDITAMAQAYREKFGLDRPVIEQYFNYWRDILRFEFGYSLSNYPETVSNSISAALPWTLGLVGVSTFISFVIGSLLGGLLAWPRIPRVLRGFIPILMVISAVPYFLLGIILIYTLAIVGRAFPAGGAYTFGSTLRFDLQTIGDILRHAALPATSIIIAGIGSWALSMRGMMISVLGEDYIKLAQAKGLRERRIFLWYGMRNSMLPQLTTLALALGYVVSGAILVEVIFSYPGLGYKLYQAIQTKDYFVVQGIVLMLIIAIGFALYVMDLIYPLIDPRIQYERA
ncbi:MAG: ABC transporter permease [Chloroflexi bacterium]|jgi:peptide/nickel transport system permease protein|nr:MAG: ABC transporter permease [Chloroflexi bacterium OLB13]MBV6437270.1 Dipeptide transport system permease protein DppB [Anaerolineae bacterium]MCC6566825.1 ABC transporter permease [Chloroflexota bacterium]MCO6442936.1 ABC transporter permease [Anaerolineae bacterium]GIK29960.1 MAG: peptide ABC transporter permease [Chloroflexota bacterium]